jgi:hypothetical protein
MLIMVRMAVRQDGTLPTPLKSSFATPSYSIGCQPLQCHMSGPESLCNCPALGYKRTGQPPKATSLNRSHDKFAQVHEHSFHTQQYNSSGRKVLRSGGLNHLKIIVST